MQNVPPVQEVIELYESSDSASAWIYTQYDRQVDYYLTIVSIPVGFSVMGFPVTGKIGGIEKYDIVNPSQPTVVCSSVGNTVEDVIRGLYSEFVRHIG